MISLEQVRQLDIRVKKAVTAVKTLSAENSVLKQQIAELEARLDDLDKEASNRIADEQQLEVSLQGVLDVLDEVDSETSEMNPEPPPANYVIEAVPEPEDDVAVENKSAERSEPEQDAAFTEVFSDSEKPESDDLTAVEIPGDEKHTPAETIPVEPESEESATEVAEPVPEEVVAEAETEDSEPEVVSLDNSGEEETESDDNDKFQSEFDIF